MKTPTYYEIRIQGHLGDSWTSWFSRLTIQHLEDGESLLRVCVDQAGLRGVLNKICDLGLPLISVIRTGPGHHPLGGN